MAHFTGEKHAGVFPSPQQTRGFTFNHTMLRVKDPTVSLAFYTKVLGMVVLRKLDFPEFKFSLYFLAKLDEEDSFSTDASLRTEQAFSRSGVLELTHNWGTEDDENCHYHNGNDTPQGFGHICFSVPDLVSAVAWFDQCHVEYVKRLEDGKMNHIAFIKDPDGYWIEIVEAANMR